MEEAAKYAQTPQPDQKVNMGTIRQVSSIPRGSFEDSGTLPEHQARTTNNEKKDNNWVYPSEQQLYNAMRRKGWSNIPEDSIRFVLEIHNSTNERTWKQIEDWEGTSDLRLARFQGRPKDLTPKAWVYSLVTGTAPFDRHDWYVERKDSEHSQQLQRYVIDYYDEEAKGNNNMPPRTYVDVRPAVDHPRGLYLRGCRFLSDSFPGISRLLKRQFSADSGPSQPPKL